jgi:hypothetical protein
MAQFRQVLLNLIRPRRTGPKVVVDLDVFGPGDIRAVILTFG